MIDPATKLHARVKKGTAMIEKYGNDASQDAMDVINRVLSEVNEIDRIVIICQATDGYAIHAYSNARSTAEQYGMIELARTLCVQRDDD